MLGKHTLKDFKNAKIEIHNIYQTFNASILLDLAKLNINVSKTCLKFYVKIINYVRATVYQIAIAYNSKVAI